MASRVPPLPGSSSEEIPPPLSDGPGLPEDEKRSRTAKFKKLEEAVSGVYMMAGGGLSTLPPQVAGTRVPMIGVSLARHRDEIAEAWTDLAEDDKRVLKALESLTSFSGWGKVIGVHLLVVGASVPGIAAVMPQPQAQTQGAPMPNGQPTGDELQMAMLMAEMFRQQQTQVRQDSPQYVAEQPPPPPPPMPMQQNEQQPRVRQEVPVQQAPSREARPRAGMPTAADMGVSMPDAPVDFPSSGSDSVRG